MHASAPLGYAPGACKAGGARSSPAPITLIFGPTSKPSPKTAAGLGATPVPALDDSPVPLRAWSSGHPAQGCGPPKPGVPAGGSQCDLSMDGKLGAWLCAGRAAGTPGWQDASAGWVPGWQAAALDDTQAMRPQAAMVGSGAGSGLDAGAAGAAAGGSAGMGAAVRASVALLGHSGAEEGLFTPLMLERLGGGLPAAGAAQGGDAAQGQGRIAGGVTPAPRGGAPLAPAGLFTPMVTAALVEAHQTAPNQAAPKALHPIPRQGAGVGGVRWQAERAPAPASAAAGAPDQASAALDQAPSPLSPDMDLLLACLHTPEGAAAAGGGRGAARAQPTFTLCPDVGPVGRLQPPPVTPEMQAIRALARPPPARDALLLAPGDLVGDGGSTGEKECAAAMGPAAGGWEVMELASESPVVDREHAAWATVRGWDGHGHGPLCPVEEEEELASASAAAPSPGAGPLRASMQARHRMHALCACWTLSGNRRGQL